MQKTKTVFSLKFQLYAKLNNRHININILIVNFSKHVYVIKQKQIFPKFSAKMRNFAILSSRCSVYNSTRWQAYTISLAHIAIYINKLHTRTTKTCVQKTRANSQHTQQCKQKRSNHPLSISLYLSPCQMPEIMSDREKCHCASVQVFIYPLPLRFSLQSMNVIGRVGGFTRVL